MYDSIDSKKSVTGHILSISLISFRFLFTNLFKLHRNIECRTLKGQQHYKKYIQVLLSYFRNTQCERCFDDNYKKPAIISIEYKVVEVVDFEIRP